MLYNDAVMQVLPTWKWRSNIKCTN